MARRARGSSPRGLPWRRLPTIEHVASIPRRAARSGSVVSSWYSVLTVAHACPYWHQKARFSGFYWSGLRSPLARLAER
jgi:hypothetical protein